jgi:3-hydroxyisobutyrate dehydrogenase-like beta-hydroxyacid dehydrogenase
MAASESIAFGFVGLGNMGSMMVQNLATYAKANGMPRVRIWNRTQGKIAYLAEDFHCELMSSPEEVARSCNVVHTCLANDEVALSVYRQMFASKVQGTIFSDHSTLYPSTSTTLQEEASEAGMHYLACPVFGPPAAAKSAGLLIALSGDKVARDTIRPHLVPTLGKGIIDCGDDSRKGALLKILGNNCILGTIELLSESFTLAEKTGFDTDLFYEFIRRSYSSSRQPPS